MTDSKQCAINCFKDEAEAILGLIKNLNNDFDKAIELIFNCKGKVIVTGVGKSGHIGAKIAATLASTGTPSFFMNPLDAYHGDLGMFTSDDIAIAISYSGQTDELLRFVPILQNMKVPIIGISSNPNSLLAQYSICHLNVSVKKEACPLNLAPTSSTTATLAMGDAIACALIKVRNFQPSDFAKFHPGGSLGKKLLSEVKDYMSTENLPIVNPMTKLSDAIIEISKAKLGIAVALDDNKNIVGVITDGDVRRAMEHHKDAFFSLCVKDIMSNNPKTVLENTKLATAEKILRDNSIHSLVVTNKNKNFVGIIDSFRCF